jgi:hypothetical protein
MAAFNIAVLTSITGGKDNLLDDQTVGDAQFVAFTDRVHPTKLWKQVPAYDKFASPRRNSRAPKMLPHQFVDTNYSIWIDGNLKLLKTPEEIVETYLKDHDIALFRHPSRNCLYDEAMVCATAGLDDPETIIEQVRRYEIEGYAKHKGLTENNFIVRRHTPKIEAFNNAWWAEYSTGSVRDQLSFMYVADRVGLRVNIIDAGWVGDELYATKGDVIGITHHLTPRNDEHYG